MELLKEFCLPIEIYRESNRFEHWTKAHKRHKEQQRAIRYLVKGLEIYKDMPITIRLTRISPRKLDKHDNLAFSFKWCVDTLADMIYPGQRAGMADGCENLKWEYDQQSGKPKEKSLRIQIFKNEMKN